MDDLLPSLAYVCLGAVLLAGVQRRFSRQERRFLWLAFAAHVCASVAQVWIVRAVYGAGDMTMYHRNGMFFAELMRRDPVGVVPEVFRMTMQRHDFSLPIPIQGTGGATATMVGIASFTSVVCFDSLYAQCIFLGLFALSGQIALYVALRNGLRAVSPQRLFAATLIPSAVFWSSGLLKETVTMAGFGWLVFGMVRVIHQRRYAGILALVAGGLLVALTKAYVFAAFAMSATVYWYWLRAGRLRADALLLRPFYLVFGAAVAVGFIILIGRVFPRYSVAEFAAEAGRLQVVGARLTAGSNYSLGIQNQSLLGQLASAPLALLTALFRPFLFEVSSITAAFNAVETAVLTFLVGRAIVRHGPRGLAARTLAEPLLMFAAVFVITFGVGVGLASTNLGSLSRYRAPLMPFFALLVLVWDLVPARLARPSVPPERHSSRRPAEGLPR